MVEDGSSIPAAHDMRLFQACHDLVVPVGFERLRGVRLQAGAYANGYGALTLLDEEDGSTVCTFTVNLIVSGANLMARVGEDSFWVRLQDNLPMWAAAASALRSTPFFEGTGTFAGAGFVERYAERWRFALCRSGLTSRCTGKGYAVLCPGCREPYEK